MIILGIETSCDDTCIAIYDTKYGLLANKKYTQPIHTIFGGVIPKFSSIYHLNKLIPIIKNLLLKLKIHQNNINAIAYTAGPGLYNSLIIGAYIAYSISYTLTIPIIGVHHLEGHIFSAMINKNQPTFPFISLLISGGHTQLLDVHNIGHYKILGESLDDSIGETFDKIAKLLNLSYPGGEKLSNLANCGKIKKHLFPKILATNLHFSFSGIKTYIFNYFKQLNFKKKHQYKANVAKSFEEYILNILSIKCYKALSKYGRSCLILSGGVSANKNLRKNFINKLKNKINNFTIYFPEKPLCTDNAAMIAYVGAIRITSGEKIHKNIIIRPTWSLEKLKYPLF
ncbi:tRNA(ANN) t(6)A37 threonylcarbamoyladenosine modification protein [Candidatus Portiera aleyrodidarum]|uniref:tRNA N6-adenosine threonylcarbamoyltransferase n=1 Tax=Candidatus Portiera aleyrodidarum TV TaxID=1297582 RepID=A0A8D3X7G2_9GAMM|nr:tRNA (adenosine(37)-N6)-threonylcarbamoyltransferase complex transferase subunit TsaD [Candidatus Portiera aleyrodidarum]AGI27148.1 O-sialoglycoprotein endopeptidase [Candidatus Portiera aleyrodidarum TV]CEI59123.1 tRNA(ANN) t(6)A37 threonylcarbamoyladenosine modification protein [Candidatus Portiera aleyrodidarum]